MTKIISVFIIVVLVFCGWKLVAYYKKVEEENQAKQKVETGADLRPENLTGMDWSLQSSLDAASKSGPNGLRDWLKVYGSRVQDPRKAWIEMDCSLALLRTEPNEAKRIFKAVKDRTGTNSLVYPRIRQLEKTFE